MGFLDGLFSKKEKAVKSDRGRKPPTNASRDRGGTPNSGRTPSLTPTAQSTFYAGLDRGKSTKNRGKEDDGISPQTVHGGATRLGLKRRGKDNVHVGPDARDDSLEARRVTPRKPTDLPKDKVKSSTLSLNSLLRNQPKTAPSQSSKPKRPTTVASLPTTHVLVRRGHKEGPNQQDNLSRTSSITNLDSLESNFQAQQGKGAKPRKAPSKERIDKQGQDGKKAKNNNKLELPTGQPLSYSSESLQEVELHQLRKQLREMADEKSSLALQLGEQRGQLNVLQKEILKLKSFQEESNVEMEKLAEENNVLRNRLRDVAHSPLSDNEKQQLLFENRHHSSAPASIATNVPDDNGGDVTTCTTPDWDKHSSGNVSEVSVACLQDKINQMQETHYSTNEELQATLQELTDLQRQLTELQQENERLNEEKTLMFDSLCRQTERLNDSRQEVENLKQLLYRERSDETGSNQFESAVEREQKLVELLRSAQEEREQLLLKLEQVQAELHESRAGNIEKTETIAQLSERVRTLECTLDAKHAEHKQLDQELAQAKDQCSGKQIEIDRLSDLLDNARTKINELEQDRTLSDKSELDELLDNARKEKDQLESEVSYLKEHLARSKNENEKLKEQVFMLQEECKVTRNNAKTTQNDLEYKCEKLASEKASLGEQLQQFQEAVNELQVQAQCHLEDKRQLSAVLSETQRNMSEAERKNLTMENELQELRKLRAEENDEWEKFQNDLLTSVRVANDFKTEAQQQLQNFILENKTYRERVRLLEGQLEKLKGGKTSSTTQTDTILTPQIIAIARNLDPAITNRISVLEHPTSNPQSPVGSTSSMEKLFPILNKERRSKSRDNLGDLTSQRSSELSSKRLKAQEAKSGLKKSKSRDDLSVEPDETFQEPKGFLNRSKSKDNVQETAEVDGKGSRGFMKWHKNRDHLELEEKPAKERKGFLKKSKSRENLEGAETEPRRSKDSLDSSSDSNKSDTKPEFFSKFIKKRDKGRSKAASHQKFMSVEEETLLKSLDSWYDNIDQNIPDELLSEEDRAVKRLKILYEDDMLKERPVAHKPKDSLAISKPLLNSVVLNPKLERIFRDPKLPTVDGEVRQSALEDVCFAVDGPERTPDEALPKSRSLEDINVFEELRAESELAPVLHSTPPNVVAYNRMSSDIYPNDSVSNPRYSSKYHVINELPQPHIYVNYENLDGIIAAIPKELPEKKLTEEQRFALKLKQALDEAEKKTTLKRMKKKKGSIRGLEISAPTLESVEKNWKLKEVLMNPKIRIAEEPDERKRHSTDISSDLGSPQTTPKPANLTKANSKSYEDISFSFIPENTLMNMYYASETLNSKESSSSSSFTSAEFNLETGNIVEKCNISLQLQTATVMTDSREDLLYNETLNKAKSKEQHSKEAIAELKKQLFDEDVHHPKIIEARQNYKSELEKVLKRIEHDELRKSLRKQRSQDDLREPEETKGHQIDGLKAFGPKEAYNDHLMDVPYVPPPQGYEDEVDLPREFTEEEQIPVTATLHVINYALPPEEPAQVLKPQLHHYEYQSAIAFPIGESYADFSEELQGPPETVPFVEDQVEIGLEADSSQNAQEEIPHQTALIEDVDFQVPTLHDTVRQALECAPPPLESPYRQEEISFDNNSLAPLDTLTEILQQEASLESPGGAAPSTAHEYRIVLEDLPVPQTAESQETIKENQYGGISPIEVRTTYRTVVKEYKSRFHPDEPKSEANDAASVNEFFNPAFDIQVERGHEGEEVALRRSEAISRIDDEMNTIMGQYLNTRASLLVQASNENVEPEQEGALEKCRNVENLDSEPLSLEDRQFIEEMKAKYASAETVSSSSEPSDLEEAGDVLEKEKTLRPNARKKETRPLSEINEGDLLLIGLAKRQSAHPVEPDVPETLPPLPNTPKPPQMERAAFKEGAKDVAKWRGESLIPVRKSSSHLPPSLRPKSQSGSAVVMRNRFSSPANKADRTSKRLSDLMFTETIFVPIATNAPPSAALRYKQDGHFNESMFVASSDSREDHHEPPCDRFKAAGRQTRDRESPLAVYSNSPNLFPAPESPKVPPPGVVKKPLPLPREHLTGVRALDVGSDFDNMTESEENSSSIGNEEANLASNVGEARASPPIDEPILVEESKAHTDIVRKLEESAVELEASGEDARVVDDEVSSSELKGASPGPTESDVEEIRRDSSNVNLFHMDSPLSYDSYLELFKSKESKEFDSLIDKKPPTKFFGVAYVEELQQDDSSSGMETKPKIVDFVPLDDKTTSVFTQEDTSYDTLEREKTFHVLEEAAKISKQDVDASLEVLARKSSSFSKSSSTSRTSFSQAKKLFEALAEANKDERPRSTFSPKSNRVSARDSKSLEHLKQKPSADGFKETTPDLQRTSKDN